MTAAQEQLPSDSVIVPGRPVYPRSAFEKAESTEAGQSGDGAGSAAPLDIGEIVRAGSIEEICAWSLAEGGNLPESIQMLIGAGDDPDDPTKYNGDRSLALFAAVCGMVRAKLTDTNIYNVITDPTWPISASVLDKGSSIDRYAKRQIQRAKDKVAADDADFVRSKDTDIPFAKSQHNIRLAIKKLGITLRRNLLKNATEIDGLEGFGPELTDAAMGRILLRIDEEYKFLAQRELFFTVVEDISQTNSYHPIRDLLAELEPTWDGLKRIDTWLIDLAGAEDTPLNRAIARIWFVAAVRRVRQPGIKFDELLILESKQGTDKSSGLRALAMRDEWFSDSLALTADPKVVIESTAGTWINEIAELDGMGKAHIEQVKALLSRSSDRARMAYARLAVTVLRQFISVGTTNSSEYLKDSTGNRRFWPVKIERFDLPKLLAVREQLWAEAATAEAAGESIRLDPNLYAAAAEAQADRQLEHPFVEVFREKLGERTGILPVGVTWEILGIVPRDQTTARNREIGHALRSLGWERARKRVTGISSTHVWVRGTTENRILLEALENSDAF